MKKLMAQLDKSKAMKIRRKEIQREAASLKNESFLNRHFEYPIHISGRGIKEWLNQPHKFYEAKKLTRSINNIISTEMTADIPNSTQKTDIFCFPAV